MAYRMIEMILPSKDKESLEDLLKGTELNVLGIWLQPISGIWEYPVQGQWGKRFLEDYILVRLLVAVEETEAWLDSFQKRFQGDDGFRISVLPVEASIPRPGLRSANGSIAVPENSRQNGSIEDAGTSKSSGPNDKPASVDVSDTISSLEDDVFKGFKKSKDRRSREELYAEIAETTRLNRVYILMVILSSTVAAIGILNDSVAVIIGAMVIAPLLGPNVALSLATTLGDLGLARQALKTNLIGLSIALFFSLLVGYFLPVDPSIHELSSRTSVGLVDVALALASGSAGALAYTTGVSATLIGVMVAVALLPPLVTFGLLFGSGNFPGSQGAMLLFLVNLICINLSGVITFLAQGIQPYDWWEVKKAKRATMVAIFLWLVMLMALVAIIILSKDNSALISIFSS